MKLPGILSSADFVKEIETMVADGGVEYIDAVIEYCHKHGLEVETAASIIKSTPTLKSKIQIEAEDLNVLPKTARLPIE